MNYLDRLFDDIEQRYGDGIDWTTMGHLSASPSSPPSEVVQQDENRSRSLPTRSDADGDDLNDAPAPSRAA